MRRRLAELLRRDSARFALTYLLVFSASVLLLGLVTYETIELALVANQRQHIEREGAQLMGEYAEDGMEELRHDIVERLEISATRRLRYMVRSPDGRTIFDARRSLVGSAGP